METATVPEPARRPTSVERTATVLLWTGAFSIAGGLAGYLLGHVWTAPVDNCGDVGRAGAGPVWAIALLALAAGALGALFSLANLCLAAHRRDRSGVSRSGLALAVAIAAVAICLGGLAVVWGDTPLFCF
ncbi:MAG TPA: hypothetical protein VFJ85_09535 [Acidimicrobiales bacterium]|nr:hypothetical protein [Acidimicrobiales bacterium]